MINKVDLPTANISRVKDEMENILGVEREDIKCVSAKTGINIDNLLQVFCYLFISVHIIHFTKLALCTSKLAQYSRSFSLVSSPALPDMVNIYLTIYKINPCFSSFLFWLAYTDKLKVTNIRKGKSKFNLALFLTSNGASATFLEGCFSDDVQ